MKIKYFRFLYCVTNSCFLHFGEVKDTKSNEMISFVYLKEAEESGQQGGGKQPLFLCPKHVDYAVLGETGTHVKEAFFEMLKDTTVGTLVIPAGGAGQFPDEIEGVDEILYLGCADEMHGRQSSGEDGKSRWYTDCLERKAAGWKISVRCRAKGILSMLHMHESDEEKQLFAGGKERGSGAVYDDFVMNVKAMDREKRCGSQAQPDEFGCALGCVLHQDYDVCKYRNVNDESGYLTGRLVLGGTKGSDEADSVVNEAERKRIRFFAADGKSAEQWNDLLPKEESGPKRYCIGTRMSDEAVAAVCRSGINRVPVVLQEGCGICCAGLMKYAEN